MHEMQSMRTGVICENHKIAPNHFLMSVMLPPAFPTPAPGQFVMIRQADRLDPLLARPVSVYGFQRRGDYAFLELLYRVVGRGTLLFSQMKAGNEVTLIGPLGKGFDLPTGRRKVIFVAGGIGVAPLIFFLQCGILNEVAEQKRRTIFYLGARSEELLVGRDHLKRLCDLRLCTDDGSLGYHGPVTEMLKNDIEGYDPRETVLFACGPTPMVHALKRLLRDNPIPCQVSIEERMACGLGACLGCTVAIQGLEGRREYVRVCKEGPVFDLNEILPNPSDGILQAAEDEI